MAIENIIEGMPEVRATLDPGQFASSSDVTTADTVQADVERLEPPTDINAAEIGEYTPYEAVSGEVQDDSTVEGRMSGLLSQNSDYIQRARTNADRMSNRRGMFNSSMAMGAAEGAAIDRALPIAQQDAATFAKQQFLNQGYDNDAAQYLAEQSVQRENLEAGLEQDTNQFNATNTLENERLNQAAQNLSGQQYANAQNLAEANAAAEQNRLNFATLDGDIRAQLAQIDNALAQQLESLSAQFQIQENLDTVNGAIYQQLVSEIGTILTNTDKPEEAQAKINALIEATGIEFEFSGGGGMAPNPLDTPPPEQTAPSTATGGGNDGGGGGSDGGGSTGGNDGGGGLSTDSGMGMSGQGPQGGSDNSGGGGGNSPSDAPGSPF